jgi:hypothetical protein
MISSLQNALPLFLAKSSRTKRGPQRIHRESNKQCPATNKHAKSEEFGMEGLSWTSQSIHTPCSVELSYFADEQSLLIALYLLKSWAVSNDVAGSSSWSGGWLAVAASRGSQPAAVLGGMTPSPNQGSRPASNVHTRNLEVC